MMSTYLTSKLEKFSLEYPDFNGDLEKAIFLQIVALQMIKLQNDSGLSLEDFARLVELPNSHISRLQSGEHNPTILTLLDIAKRCGYSLEVKVKKSRKSHVLRNRVI